MQWARGLVVHGRRRKGRHGQVTRYALEFLSREEDEEEEDEIDEGEWGGGKLGHKQDPRALRPDTAIPTRPWRIAPRKARSAVIFAFSHRSTTNP